MAITLSNINVGQFPNDTTGDTIRSAFQKINLNNANVLIAIENSNGGGIPTGVILTNPEGSQSVEQPVNSTFGIYGADTTATFVCDVPFSFGNPGQFNNPVTFYGAGLRLASPVVTNSNISASGDIFTTGHLSSLSGVSSLGGFSVGSAASSANLAITPNTFSWFINASTGPINLTLPDATTMKVAQLGTFTSFPGPYSPGDPVTIAATQYFQTGQIFLIKKMDSSANPVIITANAGQTIDGQANISLINQFDYIMVQSNGYANPSTSGFINATGWNVIGRSHKYQQVTSINGSFNGTLDGNNTIFSLPSIPVINSLFIFQNGVFVGSDGYTIAENNITFNTPPAITDQLNANYMS